MLVLSKEGCDGRRMDCQSQKIEGGWLEHSEWSRQKMADAVGRSKSWVKKWVQRIRSAPLEDCEVLNGRSRAWK
jgi:hypothetical protein